MQVQIQYIKIDASDTLNAYVEKKLNKLANKYDWLIRADVTFKKGQDKTGADSICEIELSAPGPRLFASTIAEHYEAAAKETISDLEKQLKKRKAVFATH